MASSEPTRYRVTAQLYSKDERDGGLLDTALRMGIVGMALRSRWSYSEKRSRTVDPKYLSAVCIEEKWRVRMAGETPR